MTAHGTSRPYRSVLYIPGSKERALEKATGLACDAIIFDLEDAVAVDEKVNARAILAKARASPSPHSLSMLFMRTMRLREP